MRKFDEIIFMGSKSCIEKIQQLHERLDEGLNISCGLQQPGHPDSEEAAERDRQFEIKMRNELYNIVQDIGMALTGHGWEIE